MRIVADTNVLVSATFWKGDSFKIVENVEQGKIELILSKEIIEEYMSVLNYKEILDKISLKNLEFNFLVDSLIKRSIMIESKERVNIVKDPDDNKFIEAGIAGKADYIVSQDSDLLDIKEFKEIKIVNPKDFLKIIDYHKL